MKNNLAGQLELPFLAESYSTGPRNGITPLPMQYLGSKTRIAAWLIDSIVQKFPSTNVFFDLFSGTGTMSLKALQNGYRLYTNDVQPYSYVVLKSLFTEERTQLLELAKEVKLLSKSKKLLSNGRFQLEAIFEEEKDFFDSVQSRINFNWRKYCTFSDQTQLVHSNKEIDLLKKSNEWNLFSKYYANTYFGVRQCLSLDTLREFADDLEPSLKYHLLASTISVMTYAVTSTTHLAQYLKPTSEDTARHIILRRSMDIIDLVSQRLQDLYNYPLPIKKAHVMNLDYQDAFEKVRMNKKWVVYIDPPYFKEHYSRYYHVLDTFFLYDYPYLTFNPRTCYVTSGRYREDRIVSDFGLRSRVEKAFQSLLDVCYKCEAKLAISYASTSLVSQKRILELADNVGYKADFEQIKLIHSGQGQPRHRSVSEYLFLLEP